MIYELVAPVAFFMAISMIAGAGETTSSGGADSAPAYEAAQVAGGTLTISTILQPHSLRTEGVPREFVLDTYFRGKKLTPANQVFFQIAKFNEPGALTYCKLGALNPNGPVELPVDGTFPVHGYADDDKRLIVKFPDASNKALFVSCYRSPEGGLGDHIIRVTPEVIDEVFGDIATLKY